jgi:hypothetical protein
VSLLAARDGEVDGERQDHGAGADEEKQRIIAAGHGKEEGKAVGGGGLEEGEEDGRQAPGDFLPVGTMRRLAPPERARVETLFIRRSDGYVSSAMTALLAMARAEAAP